MFWADKNTSYFIAKAYDQDLSQYYAIKFE
jgi:hypothetical protein